MKPIKFRAWDGQKMTNIVAIAGNGNLTTWNSDDEEALFPQIRSVDWPVMQFTGLKDKAGIDIYEGDIVDVTNKSKQGGIKVVVYDQTTFSFVLIWPQFYSRDYNTGKSDATWLKISSGISCVHKGNIYEHPLLLTKNNKE